MPEAGPVQAAPLVSVVIPFYNGQIALLDQTLHSVRAQSYAAIEIIIVDDGSGADHAEALADLAPRYDAQVVHQPNAGPAAARNTGAAHATGQWLAFLDGDDLWQPEKIAAQVALAGQPGNAGKLILTRTASVSETGDVLSEYAYDAPADADAFVRMILQGRAISFTSALFLEKAAFDQLGGFDPALRFREDQHLLLRAVRAFGWACVPQVLSMRVIHQDSYSAPASLPPAAHQFAHEEAFAKALDGQERLFNAPRFLVRSALRIGKRRAALGQTAEAFLMARKALRLSPTTGQAWALVPAAALARIWPRPFRRWLPKG